MTHSIGRCVMDEGFDYYIEDFDDKARELNSLYQGGAINIDVDSELEQSIQELNALKDEYSKEDAPTLFVREYRY